MTTDAALQPGAAPATPNAASQVALVSDEVTPYAQSLFQQPWWLAAVAPERWDAAVIVKNGEVVGRLPFVRKRRFGLTILSHPPLTPFLGPWVKAATDTIRKRLTREQEILRSLIGELPEHDIFVQDFHHSVTNCIEFHWNGFSETVRYTYILDRLDELDRIWAGFGENVRGHIRKAGRRVIVRPLDDIETFIALNRMTFERQGLSLPHSEALIRRLDAACRARGVRRIFLAEDGDGVPHAALYLVWDSESAYNLMSGSDPLLRSSGAMTLLMWEAIKFAGQVTKHFDFEGSMVPPIERFFRSFGPRQVRYPRLTRGATLKGRLAVLAHEWRHARKGRSA